jgi:hypothetical protein
VSSFSDPTTFGAAPRTSTTRSVPAATVKTNFPFVLTRSGSSMPFSCTLVVLCSGTSAPADGAAPAWSPRSSPVGSATAMPGTGRRGSPSVSTTRSACPRACWSSASQERNARGHDLGVAASA